MRLLFEKPEGRPSPFSLSLSEYGLSNRHHLLKEEGKPANTPALPSPENIMAEAAIVGWFLAPRAYGEKPWGEIYRDESALWVVRADGKEELWATAGFVEESLQNLKDLKVPQSSRCGYCCASWEPAQWSDWHCAACGSC